MSASPEPTNQPPISSEKAASYQPPRGILETVIYATDLEQAHWFYHEVLGLEVASWVAERHVFFRLPGGMLLVFNPTETSQATVQVGGSTIPRHGATGSSHFAFNVAPDQLDAVRRHLHQQDIAIESEICWPGGGRSIYCRDPAGNSVEFATPDLWYK
jgi:catechol 2,3-dioxygenase-like lactoylglutathione lyase family enzyme